MTTANILWRAINQNNTDSPAYRMNAKTLFVAVTACPSKPCIISIVSGVTIAAIRQRPAAR